jgi:hypothetical protein
VLAGAQRDHGNQAARDRERRTIAASNAAKPASATSGVSLPVAGK